MTSDELFSDDSLESEWTFAVSITDAGGGIVTRSTWPWTQDPFHGGRPYSLGFVFGPNTLPSDDHNIWISVTGKDKDYFPFNPDDQLPSIGKNWTKQDATWGSDSTDIPGGPNGVHVETASNDEIKYSLTYTIQIVDRPLEVIFRAIC